MWLSAVCREDCSVAHALTDGGGQVHPAGMVESDRPARGMAVVLPGRNYGPRQPLLHFAARAAEEAGWTVAVADWAGASEPSQIAALARAVLDPIPADEVLIIGKSLGSLLLPHAAEHNLPGVWLTPLLDRAAIRAAVARLSAPSLLVGGTADPTWDHDVAAASGHQIMELDGGDHALERPGDVLASVRFLQQLTTAVAHFAAAGHTAS